MSDSSQNIISNLKRINLISGKGGVGRTTLATTLALGSAATGKKTLLIEMEDDSGWESPLAKTFGYPHFQVVPHLLKNNLYGLCLSAAVGQERFLNSFLRMPKIAQMVMSNQGVKWFLEGAPAFREMGVFYHLLMALKDDFETIILDMPATGHLVGLARLPRVLLKMMPIGPIADRLKEGQSYFYDKNQTAAWVVTLPQTLPVSEALELKNSLMQENIPLGGYILNKVPFNPFTEEEEKILESLSQKSQTKRLLVDLERIRRLRDAERRLKDEHDLPIWLSPETFNPIGEEQFFHRIVPLA